MQKLKTFICCLLCLPLASLAQVMPRDGSILNYRMIGFSFPAAKGIKYRIELARGICNDEQTFNKNILKTINIPGKDNNKVISEVPEFGMQYTWREVPSVTKDRTTGSFHHFQVGRIPNADPSKMRLRVTNNTGKYNDLFIFADGNRVLYNLRGEAVWYLPNIEGLINEEVQIRDLKCTAAGTITFILREKIYEISYDGTILWKGPENGSVSGGNSEHFHHEYTRLSNGHYMVLGKEYRTIARPVSHAPDSVNNDEDTAIKPIEFGTVIEYDKQGNVLWSWRTADYFITSGFYKNAANYTVDPHQNAFFFDEKNKRIYISFRDISTILKVKYPEGKITNIYGNSGPAHNSPPAESFFCFQHSCRKSHDGYLYLFDNNCCNKGALPKVIMMKEPGSANGQPEKVWEFECPATDAPDANQFMFKSGGNVAELTDGAFFISVSGSFDEFFIVNRAKKTEWSAVPEKWVDAEKKWKMMPQYRGSVVNGMKNMEQLIWHQ